MNDVCSALRTAAIEQAVRVLEGQKLEVPGRDRDSGEHRLDLVATSGSDILVAVEVRISAQGSDASACVAALTEARLLQFTTAAREWLRQRKAVYDDLRVVAVSVDRAGGVGVAAGNAATGVA